MLWSSVIDVVRGTLFVLAHWCGGSFGAAIIVASVVTRLALLPLTLRATRRRLERVRDKITTPDPRGMLDMLDMLVGAPAAIALYSAIRSAGSSAGKFLWIGNLAKPDRLVTLVAAATSAGIAWLSMTSPAGKAGAQVATIIVPAVVTFFILSHLSAGLAVYSVTNSLIVSGERFVASRTLRPVRA